jgi:hypothetical protein
MYDVLSQGGEGMLGREGKAGWLRQAGAGLVSSPANEPHGRTTPRPPPHAGGELPGWLPFSVKEGLGVVVPRRNAMDRQSGLTRNRKVRKGRNQERRLLLCASLRLGVLARAALVLTDIASPLARLVRGTLTICKNGGNKAKKSLKTKEVSITTNPNGPTSSIKLVFQTHASNMCCKRLYEPSSHRIHSASGVLPRTV